MLDAGLARAVRGQTGRGCERGERRDDQDVALAFDHGRKRSPDGVEDPEDVDVETRLNVAGSTCITEP